MMNSVQFGRVTYVPEERMRNDAQFFKLAENAAKKNLSLKPGDDNPYQVGAVMYLTGDGGCADGFLEIKANQLNPGDRGKYFITNTDTPDETAFFQHQGKVDEKLKSVVDKAKEENRLVVIA